MVIDHTSLIKKALSCLRNNKWVSQVDLYGSLSNGTADQYSDIDLHVILEGISDREFAEMLPDVLQSIDEYILVDWGPTALPDCFIRVLNFKNYPLFWHLDIWCESEIHADGNDLKSTFHWPFLFRAWVDELKKIIRGQKDTNVLDKFVKEAIGFVELSGMLNERLSVYLDILHKYIKSKTVSCDELYIRCDALRREYIKTGTIKIY